MTGQDDEGRSRDFFGVRAPTGDFALSDPMRNIVTYDFGGADIDASTNPPLPAAPVLGPARQIAALNPAAVSAHFHGTCVFDFFNDELKRNGIDNKGMPLISVVNVWSSRGGRPHPDWPNAVWWNKRMWYGASGGTSYARFLTIIAHELTHGVTESSAGLVYRDLPGALNESWSDIFGVIVANWFPNEPNDGDTWDWTMGDGLGQGGGPLRDLSDPASTGQPDHMVQYVPLPYSKDYGGVHIYSGIHNKAIHNLLTEKDDAGDPTFPIREAVLILYLTLTRLTRTSDFTDSRRTMENVTSAHYGNTPLGQTRLAAVGRAFQSVGI
jgi:Zn-dependent metalloprotease